MPTVVTKAKGGTAQPVGVLYIEPDRQVVDASAKTALTKTGLNAPFMADLLSACLAHERCGVHLYRSVAARTTFDALRKQYEHFGEETLEHVRLLEELISSSGGDPQYVSAAARATEKAASGIVESTFMLRGSVDETTAELAMLEAVVLAETKDQANWELLATLASQMDKGSVRTELEKVSKKVLEQEQEHYSWAREARTQMILTLATGNGDAR
jgi:rubrerythrin